MTRFRIYIQQRGIHTHLRVFAGAEGSRSIAGELVLRADEADAFFGAIQTGNVGPEGCGATVEIAIEPRGEPLDPPSR